MALQHYYIDSSLDSATGAGTAGDPWGRIDHAFAQQPTLAAGTLTVFNVKGTSEASPETGVASGLPTGASVSAQGMLSPYTGVPFDTTGLLYLDFGTTASWTNVNLDWWSFHQIHFSGGNGTDGYRQIADLDNNINFKNCIFNGSYFNGDNSFVYDKCSWINMRPTNFVAKANSVGRIVDCYFEISGNSVTSHLVQATYVHNCVFNIDGSTNDCIGAIASLGDWRHNTFYYKSGSTGNRRSMEVDDMCTVKYNYIEGAGRAFQIQTAAKQCNVQNNVLFNVGTISGGDQNTVNTAELNGQTAATVTLSSSALTDPENGDFTITQDFKDQTEMAFQNTGIGFEPEAYVDTIRYAGAILGFPAGGGDGGGTTGKQGLHGIEFGGV